MSSLELAHVDTKPYEEDSSQIEQEIEIGPELREMLTRSLRLEINPKSIKQAVIEDQTFDTISPVFLLHPGAGFCLPTYYKLHSLGRPAYAIHDPRTLATSEEAWESILDVAEEYTKMILETTKRNPQTPIIMAGYSFGGIVAFEVSRRLLETTKRSIAGVLLIDAPPPLSHETLTRETIEALVGVKFERDNSRKPSNLAQVIEPLMLRNNLRAARLLGKYRPESSEYSPTMILLRSREGCEIRGRKLPHNEWLNDRRDVRTAVADWEQVVGREVKVVDIPGNHFEVFEPENFDAVSAAIKAACDELSSE